MAKAAEGVHHCVASAQIGRGRHFVAVTLPGLAPAFGGNHHDSGCKLVSRVDRTLATFRLVRQDVEILGDRPLKTGNRAWPREALRESSFASTAE
jgi:hypothetical protein